eukprot:6575259-Pyramimonas_sp.AAC.1
MLAGAFRFVRIFRVVDDITLCMAGKGKTVANGLGLASFFLCQQLERVCLIVSRTKGVAVSTQGWISKDIANKLKRWKFRNSQSTKNSGVDFKVRGRAGAKGHLGRIGKLQPRAHRFRALRSAAVGAKRILMTGGLPAGMH